MSALPYFNLYCAEFRDGVRRLSEGEVGIYTLLLTLLYETDDGRLRDDDRGVASDMSRDVRVWRRVKAQLIALGKIEVREGWIMNPRAEREIAKRERVSAARSDAGKTGGKASGKVRRTRDNGEAIASSPGKDVSDFSRTSARSPKEVFEIDGAKVNAIKDKCEAIASKQEQEQDISSTADKSAAELSAAPPLDPPPELHPPDPVAATRPLDRCLAAAGPGLGDPTKHASLMLSAHRIAAALAAGCDLDLDILPVIAAKTAKARGDPITTWSYFDRPWADARDKRLAQFAAPDPTRFAGAPHGQTSQSASQRRGTGSYVDAALRAIDRMERPGADSRQEAGCIGGEGVDLRRAVAG